MTLAICGRDLDLLQSRPWLFKATTVGLFSTQLLHFSPELLAFRLLFFVSAKYIAIKG